MIRERGRALVGALALAGTSPAFLLAAPPAAASVCSFGIDRPTAGAVSSTANVRFTGTFTVEEGLTRSERVLEVAFTRSPGPPPAPVTASGLDVGSDGLYDVQVGPLPRNGRYTARVTARHAGDPVIGCAGGDRREVTATVTFGVSVRAQPPANVRSGFDAASRRAMVTWGRSSDPDVAGYTITRVGAGPAKVVQVPPAPLTWTDAQIPAGAATITYFVQAARNGPDPNTTSEPSTPVAAEALSVPGAAAPTTVPNAGTPGRDGTPLTATPSTTVPFALGPPVTAATPGPDDPPPLDRDGTLLPPLEGTPEADPLPPDPGQEAFAGEDRGGGDGARWPVYAATGLAATAAAGAVLWRRRRDHAAVGAADAPPELEPVAPAPVAPAPPGHEPVASALPGHGPVAAAAANAFTPAAPGALPGAVESQAVPGGAHGATAAPADREAPGSPAPPDDPAPPPRDRPILILRPRAPEAR